MIDPEDRNMIVYSQNGVSKTLDESDDLSGADTLPDFSCKVADFFSWPTASTATP